MHSANIRTNIASWLCGHGCHKAMNSPNGRRLVKPGNQQARSYRPGLLMRAGLPCGWLARISPASHPPSWRIVRLRPAASLPRPTARAPHRLEIVSNGVQQVEPMPLGQPVRLDHDAVPAIVAVQPGALAEPHQHGKVGLLPSCRLLGCDASLSRFVAPGKPKRAPAPCT